MRSSLQLAQAKTLPRYPVSLTLDRSGQEAVPLFKDSKSHLSLAKLSLLHLALEQATHTHLTQQHIAHYPVQPPHLPVEMLTPALGEEMQHSLKRVRAAASSKAVHQKCGLSGRASIIINRAMINIPINNRAKLRSSRTCSLCLETPLKELVIITLRTLQTLGCFLLFLSKVVKSVTLLCVTHLHIISVQKDRIHQTAACSPQTSAPSVSQSFMYSHL